MVYDMTWIQQYIAEVGKFGEVDISSQIRSDLDDGLLGWFTWDEWFVN